MIGFLQNLKDGSIFNSLVDIKALLERAYSLEISGEQMETEAKKYIEEEAVNSFYVEFFRLSTRKEKQR